MLWMIRKDVLEMLKSRLQQISEEEGQILFYDGQKEWMCVQYFIISDEETELKVICPEIAETINEIENIPGEVISKVTECVVESFRLLWEEGYDETILVEQKGSNLWKILDSTNVVEEIYSECMMRRSFGLEVSKKESLNSSDNFDNLLISEEEGSLACESRDGAFYCRLLPHAEAKEAGNCFYLYEVEVDEAQRNRGIATKCLQQLFRQLCEKDRTGDGVTILLQVGSYNEPAVHLYEKLGFEIQEELCCYVPTEFE